jgi:hypothetical protein
MFLTTVLASGISKKLFLWSVSFLNWIILAHSVGFLKQISIIDYALNLTSIFCLVSSTKFWWQLEHVSCAQLLKLLLPCECNEVFANQFSNPFGIGSNSESINHPCLHSAWLRWLNLCSTVSVYVFTHSVSLHCCTVPSFMSLALTTFRLQLIF